jgi:hypothetical protein
MRVFRVPIEKLAEIEETLTGCVPDGGEATMGQWTPTPCGGPVLPDGPGNLPVGSVSDGALGGDNLPKKSAGGKWKLGAKLAGLVIVAACVSGELSAEVPAGQIIHAHGGHENKRSVLRRSVPDGPKSKPDGPDNLPVGNLSGGGGGGASGAVATDHRVEGDASTGNLTQCVHLQPVDWCEFRVDDCFCWQRQRRCRWDGGGGTAAREDARPTSMDGGGLSATVTSGFQDVKREVVARGQCEPVAGPLPKALPGEPRYSLRKGLGCWELVFAGRKATINNWRGVHIVAYLLQNPPVEPVHAVPLETKVWGREWAESELPGKEPRTSDEDAEEQVVEDDAMDAEASGAKLDAGENFLLKKKFRELLEIIEDATLPQAERDAAQSELDEIHASLDGAAGRVVDGAAKAAVRVRRAIKRLHTKLENAIDEKREPNVVLRDFADHILTYLIIPSSRFNRGRGSRNRAGVAGTFIYEPPRGVAWD